ncbi:MAG TPA: hypothetical protein VFS40_15540 [Gemmatimonadales bacterium]|nr:hypothetical protein [Gemmatimonadales bacterium]
MSEPAVSEHHLVVARTARWYRVGGGTDGRGPVETVWLVLHGYGDSAERFARACAPLAGPGRLVVAAEALSRFYVQPPASSASGAAHAAARVGASWMTREDRAAEIADYVAYLDALYASVSAAARGATWRVLGFSQGVATAARWTALGAAPVARLVLWGGDLPGDLDLEAPAVRARLAAARPVFVAGERDEAVPPAVVEAGAARLARHDIGARLLQHAGGHRLDRALLAELAEEP